MLAEAKNPVIVCGGGLVMADGVEACVKLAELLQVRIKNPNTYLSRLVNSSLLCALDTCTMMPFQTPTNCTWDLLDTRY